MDHNKLTNYLEVLCQSGCDRVYATIEAMENNQPASVIDELTADERLIILQELKTIMAVYKHPQASAKI